MNNNTCNGSAPSDKSDGVGERVVLSPGGQHKTSWVWRYVKAVHPAPGVVRYECAQIDNTTNRPCQVQGLANTTNIANHLKNCHNIEKPTPPKSESILKHTKRVAMQNSSDMPSVPSKALDALMAFFCVTSLPFSAVEDPNLALFVELVRKEPNLKLPRRQSFSNTVLDSNYAYAVECIRNIFQNCDSFAVTTDGWSNSSLQHYWSVTLHAINQDWSLLSNVLAAEPIFPFQAEDGCHTAKAVSKLLLNVFNRARMDQNKICALVTDKGGAAPAIVKNMRPHVTGNIEQQICAAHRIQTVLRNAFAKMIKEYPLIGCVITSVKSVVRLVRSSTRWLNVFTVAELSSANLPVKLQQETEVRWNSLLASFQSVRSSWVGVTRICSDPSAPAKVKSLAIEGVADIIGSLISVLEQFKLATDAFCYDKRPTLCYVVPVATILLEYVQRRRELCSKVLPLADFLASGIKEQFVFTDAEKMAFALHPMSLVFLNKASTPIHTFFKQVLEDGLNLLSNFCSTYSTDTAITPPEPSLPTNIPSSVWTSNFAPEPESVASVSEIDRYIKSAVVSGLFDMARLEAFDLLSWWKINEPQFPVISKIARRVLAIPASQTTSERLFSMLGMTCSERRGSLDPIKANKQLVVRLSNRLAWSSIPSKPTRVASEEVKFRREESKKASRYRKALKLSGVLPQSTTPPPLPSSMDIPESIELGLPSDKNGGISLRLMDEIESDEYSSASSDDDTVALDTFSETSEGITTSRSTPSTTSTTKRTSAPMPDIPPAKRPRTRSRAITSTEPVMELAVVSESTDMIMAYFKNVGSEYEPNWDVILGTNKQYFCNFRFVAKHGGTQCYSMELSNVGSRSFRNSRKSALANLGHEFLLEI